MSLEMWKLECQKVYDKIIKSEPKADYFTFLGSLSIILNYHYLEKENSKNSCGKEFNSIDFPHNSDAL